jgi:hypothetical protein
MPVVLAPLMAFDTLALTISVPACARQWHFLPWPERWSRLLQFHGILGRLVCVVTLCILAPDAIALLPFYFSFAGQLLLNALSLQDKGVFARVMFVDGGMCILATQAYCKLHSVIRWSWASVAWPLWVFVALATTVGAVAGVVSSRPHRLFWAASTAVFGLLGIGLANAGRHMDGEDVEPWKFFVPVLMASGLVFCAAVCASIGFAAAESLCILDDETDSWTGSASPPASLDDDGLTAAMVGQPLPAGSEFPLEVVSSTFFRAAAVPPSNRCDEDDKGHEACGSDAFATKTGEELLLPPCLVCVDREADAVVVDCGHGGLCHLCAPRTVKRFGGCCICRARCWKGVARLELGESHTAGLGDQHLGVRRGAVVNARVLEHFD